VGVMLAQECSRICARRHRPNLHLGMGEQQSKQLSARIAGGTRHGNPYNHLHEYAMLHNFMHFVSRGSARLRFGVRHFAENRYDVKP
jgi:hypothetical protein